MAEYRFAGNRLREAREQHGLTRKELADSIERSESMVTLWELDYRQPLVEKLIEMAAILGVPVEAFFIAITEVPA
jgi:transcriptional regulator with XRE-family HTH domain